MRSVVFPFFFAALLPTASQATNQQVDFRVPVTNTGNYQTFCPDHSLAVVTEFFKEPKELGGYLSTGSYFKSRSKSSVQVRDDSIVHQAPRIAAVYFFEEGTDKGREGTFILAKGFFDKSNSGRWEPMISVSPRLVDKDRCYTLKK